jgi:hypothetical protein
MADPLLGKDVLRRVHRGNRKAAFCSGSVVSDKPSDGLEPSTPSLPWRFESVTRVHARPLASTFVLQIAPRGGADNDRA